MSSIDILKTKSRIELLEKENKLLKKKTKEKDDIIDNLLIKRAIVEQQLKPRFSSMTYKPFVFSAPSFGSTAEEQRHSSFRFGPSPSFGSSAKTEEPVFATFGSTAKTEEEKPKFSFGSNSFEKINTKRCFDETNNFLEKIQKKQKVF